MVFALCTNLRVKAKLEMGIREHDRIVNKITTSPHSIHRVTWSNE